MGSFYSFYNGLKWTFHLLNSCNCFQHSKSVCPCWVSCINEKKARDNCRCVLECTGAPGVHSSILWLSEHDWPQASGCKSKPLSCNTALLFSKHMGQQCFFDVMKLGNLFVLIVGRDNELLDTWKEMGRDHVRYAVLLQTSGCQGGTVSERLPRQVQQWRNSSWHEHATSETHLTFSLPASLCSLTSTSYTCLTLLI